MITIGTIVGLLVVVTLHTVVATVMTRFFRLRLDTRGGAAVFSLFLIPVALFLSLLLFGQAIPGRMEPNTLLLVAIVLPITLGFAVDLFWMPHPEEVELARSEEG